MQWWLNANHHGGYSFRICKVPEEGVTNITEDCFQNNSLFFESDTLHVYQVDNGNCGPFSQPPKRKTWQQTPANRITIGSVEWTQNPFTSTHRSPPTDCHHGFIRDHVRVPSDIEPGKYVLSFRWDCEWSHQVWSMCADIDVVDPVNA